VLPTLTMNKYNENSNNRVRLQELGGEVLGMQGLRRLAEATQSAPSMQESEYSVNTTLHREVKLSDNKINKILEKLTDLEKCFNAFIKNRASDTNSRNKKNRNLNNCKRNLSQDSKPTPKSNGKPGLCSFHRRFGDKATRCTVPCEKNGQIYNPSQESIDKPATNCVVGR